MAEHRAPASTYRLQLHAGFGFLDAAAVVPYLSRLGVSHLYLSPILQATPGSMHGYDVVDHSRVSTELGGQSGLEELAAQARRHGLGLVVDVVPNHMAIPAPEHLNRQLWQTLREGRTGSTAHWFDIDWDRCDGRLGLPMLGSSLEETVASGALTIGDLDGERVLRYEDHCFPLAAGSGADGDTDDVLALLARQHYVLADWREKGRVLNYRRFFDVDTLVAIRVEREDVFDATHAVLLDLYRAGVVDGFRIDHPDGLADPLGYLERLRAATEGAWVVVEKILEPGETLPGDWPCAGTTGYDAIRALQGALVPPVGDELSRRWQQLGGEPSYRTAELGSKRQVIFELFQPEVGRLTRLAVSAAEAAGEPLATSPASEALAEMLAQVAVYRAYLRPGVSPAAESLRRISVMCSSAARSRPDLAETVALLQRLLTDTDARGAAGRDLVVWFQQVCGPVMAKGVEDTAYYRWHRMVALNEVGGDPLALDSPTRDHLHGWARTQAAHYPFGMTGLSTHDTKRNEDVRARLLAVAEDLDGWDTVTEAVAHESAACDVDPATAYLLAQTLIGSWPIDAERLTEYLLKAAREAKQLTTWGEPDEHYESRVDALARRCLADPVASRVETVLAANAAAIRSCSLGSKLVQLTLPGVPDVYQGSELAEPALVDPDNRRPVDYDRRAALLQHLDDTAAPYPAGTDLDTEKMWVTSRALRLRRDRPDLFDAASGYRSLESVSPHLLGFLRGAQLATLVTRWPGRLGRAGWKDTTIVLPPGEWTDVLTDTRHVVSAAGARAEEVLRALPVALLLKDAR